MTDDSAGRRTGETWVGVPPSEVVTYTYDNADRLLTVDDDGTTGLPRVTLTYGYDNVGNRTSVGDSLGGLTSYGYDVRDELTQVTQSGSGVANKRVDLAYDAGFRRTTLTRYSDLSGTTTVQVTKSAYDAADRLTTLTHQTGGGTVRAQYVYVLDAASRLTSETRTWNGGTTDTVSYTYTNDDQVTGVSHTNGSFANESFGYDANGNRNTSGYSTGTGNRLSGDGTYTYTYDDEGNLTGRTKVSDGSQTAYHWDYRNRLTGVDSVVSGATTVLATYVYDALDRRIKVVEGGATLWTLYDGMSPILDFNGSGAQVARYLCGDAVDELFARETSGGTVAWYLPDRLGTIRDLIDTSGSVIDHVDYGVFGKVEGESNPSNGDGFKFAGMRYSAVAGLHLAQARWYDPSSGRFVSLDPIGFAGRDLALYRYVKNEVTDAIDPSGMQQFKIPDDFMPKKPPKAFYPTAEELADPSMFPELTEAMKANKTLSAEDLRERGFVVLKNRDNGKYRIAPTPPGSEFGINLNYGYNPDRKIWSEVCTVHTHPPNKNGKPDPADSPDDPKNSNRPIGKSPVRVPWLVIGPDGTLFVIGPDKRGGRANRDSRKLPFKLK